MKSYYLIVGALLLACGADSKVEDSQDESILVYADSSDFLKKQEDKLLQEYRKLFEFVADKVGSVEFSVKDAQTYNSDTQLMGLVISAKGIPNWSYAEKLILVSKRGQILFASPFRQIDTDLRIPECGVPDYSLGQIDINEISGTKFIFAELDKYYYGCAGQPQIKIKTCYIYLSSDYSKIDSLELVFRKNDASGELTERETSLEIEGNQIITSTNDGTALIIRKYKLNNLELKEQK